MRRILFLVLAVLILLTLSETKASTYYTGFESITLSHGKLLENYSKNDYDKYYKNVTKRKFWGWSTHEVNKNIKVSYISETLFSYYNDGYTPIDYKYSLSQKKTTKFNISATGSIGIKNSKTGKTFKDNLDASLKISVDYQINEEQTEKIDIALKVDPGTQVDLYYYGEGKISNGVAAHYLFWLRNKLGGYEVFVVTTQYQRLEKKRI
ncbi:MAG: hypothetical protein WC964_01755 [Acholeplasmataceae bacterium]